MEPTQGELGHNPRLSETEELARALHRLFGRPRDDLNYWRWVAQQLEAGDETQHALFGARIRRDDRPEVKRLGLMVQDIRQAALVDNVGREPEPETLQ